MTTSTLMSLPIDIVWKRLALDDEMMWLDPPGLVYPNRWIPTVTIFYAHPQADLIPDEYKENIITYLKIVCSITGTNLLNDSLTKGEPWPIDHEASKVIAKNLAVYYGCYGAILEVDVTPYQADENISPSDYPYFLDFQPKKREIYEAVTESGEILSGSKQSTSVRKSISETEDIEYAEGIATPTVPQIKGIWHEEISNVRNIDASRENREKFSHTTNLSQLYHQLNSYHLGTNRALFFLQPRPHVVDPKHQTFLFGPRRLEGIQEFFFVVIQPKSHPGLCVSAGLQTGHFAFNKIPGQAIKPNPIIPPPKFHYHHPDPETESHKDYEGGNTNFQPPTYVAMFDKEIVDKEINTDVNKGQEKTWDQVKTDKVPIMKGPGWTLKIDTNLSKNKENIVHISVDINDMGVRVSSLTKRIYKKENGNYKLEKGFAVIHADVIIYLNEKNSATGFPKDNEIIDFFTKIKKVGACLDKNGKIYTYPTNSWFQDKKVRKDPSFPSVKPNQPHGKMQSINDLNMRIIEAMKDQDELVVEMHGPGPVSNPLYTDFAIQQFRESISERTDSEWLQSPVGALSQISERKKNLLIEKGVETRAQLVEIPLQHLQRMLQMGNEEVRKLYLNAWDIPTSKIEGNAKPRKG